MPEPIHLAEVGSTNDWLRQNGAGLADGQWLFADRQTGGRGRLGRPWEAPAGNLSASCLVRLRPGETRPWELSFVMALAAHETVSHWVEPARTILKWPNDLLLDGAKLSGILIEAEQDMLVAGIGVNLAAAPDIPGRRTVALADIIAGPPPEPAVFLARLRMALESWRGVWATEGWERLRAEWMDRAHAPGTMLRVGAGEALVEGQFAGLSETGALRVRGADGRIHELFAGDVDTGGAGGV